MLFYLLCPYHEPHGTGHRANALSFYHGHDMEPKDFWGNRVARGNDNIVNYLDPDERLVQSERL